MKVALLALLVVSLMIVPAVAADGASADETKECSGRVDYVCKEGYYLCPLYVKEGKTALCIVPI